MKPEAASKKTKKDSPIPSADGEQLRSSTSDESGPPADELEKFAGYEDATYTAVDQPPPPAYAETMGLVTPATSPADRRPLPDEFDLSHDDLRQALLDEVAEHCCWGSRAARNMKIVSSELSTAVHYRLESFVERRSTSQAHQPYRGESVDGRENGQPPGAWGVSVSRPESFDESRRELPVPHTEHVRSCFRCNGSRSLVCSSCAGRGMERCLSCGGSGHRIVYHHGHSDYEDCTNCYGSGRRQCWSCYGSGRILCSTCDGRGRLKHYIKLTVLWQIHTKDFIIERTALPDKLIVKVSGQEAFREQSPRLHPLSSFPQQKVIDASEEFIREHAELSRHSLILMQRHRLQLVPVFEVGFEYAKKERKYFVYGYERKVYAPEYPHQCCCGCCGCFIL